MATTAREACGMVCLLVMVNACGTQMDRCLPGECSAWEWDSDEADGDERRGHCMLACCPAAPPAGGKAAAMH